MDGARIGTWALALCIASYGWGRAGAADNERLPVPDAAAQQAAAERIEQQYRISKRSTAAEQLALATELHALTAELDRQRYAAERYAALRAAMELELQAGDAGRMLQTVQLIAEQYEVDDRRAQLVMLWRFAEQAHTASAIESLVVVVVPLAEQAAAEHRYEDAVELAELLQRAATRMAGTPQREEIVLLRARIADQRQRWQEFAAAQAVVAAEGTAPQTEHTVIGCWYAFQQNDWRRALTHLAQSSDTQLVALAALEQQTPVDSAERHLHLARQWWEAAEAAGRPAWHRAGMQRRAIFWYLIARPRVVSRVVLTEINEHLSQLDRPEPLKREATEFLASAEAAATPVRTALDLPSLVQRDRVALVELDAQAGPFKLDLVTDAADLPPDHFLRVEPIDELNRSRWKVVVARSSAERGVTLAEWTLDDQTLHFQWDYRASHEVANQLRNCLLIVRGSSSETVVALRKPVVIDAQPISTSRSPDPALLSLRHMPRFEQLHVGLEGLDAFIVPAEVVGSPFAPGGQEVVASLTDYDGAELRVSLQRRGTDSLALRVQPMVVESGQRMALSIERVATMKRSATESLAARQQALAVLERQYQALTREVERLEKFQPRDPMQQLARTLSLVHRRRDRTGAAMKIREQRRRIGELERRLAAIPNFEALLEALEGAPVSFSIFVPLGTHELVLLEAG